MAITKVILDPEMNFSDFALVSEPKNEEDSSSPVAYYCKNCKKLVKVTHTKTLTFICNECQKNKIAFGTEKSLQSFYHIN